MADLLIELFSEEIPARMQKNALADLTRMMSEGMANAGLTYGDKSGFVTPRRLVLMMSDVPAMSMPKTEERKGPRVDAPEKALEGFLRGAGLTKDQLKTRDDPKGAFYVATMTAPGRSANDIIAEALEKTIRNFPWPKSMRWGDGDLKWVRPLHSIIAVMSDGEESEIVPFEIAGIKASNTTHGHRFLAPDEITVHNAEDYMAKLAKANVILDPIARADHIRNEATNAAFAIGLSLIEDEKLLNENAGLVEYPVVYLGEIEEQFRTLPAEVLQTSMAEHQKFLSLKNADGQITGYVIVANRSTKDNGAMIKAGNAKVLRARLSDAVFFWENDLRNVERHGVEPWLEKLSNVTFHNKLGTQGERIDRIVELSREIAPMVGASPDDAATAAKIAKADLASEMVYEFPELQGVMGTYYAKAAGHSNAIANVCTTHYAPLGPSDDVPTEPTAIAVSLADKFDILTGFWAIDEKPTGSKDPFALRRSALGIVRIILENDLRISLADMIGKGHEGANSSDLTRFIIDRLNVYLRDQNIRHDVIGALKNDSDDLALLVKRVKALDAFLKTDDGTNMQAGIKRALNILSAEEKKDGVSFELDPDPKLMKHDAEIALQNALDKAEATAIPALKSENFEEAMSAIGQARSAVDTFFTDVIVNDDNAIIRRNRLCILNRIRVLSVQICDFSELEG